MVRQRTAALLIKIEPLSGVEGMLIREVEVKRILNPTAIDLGEYVINPYKGCEYSCLYCYVRFNKAVLNDPRQWGEYVDVRINAAEMLGKELMKKKPRRVLLGSTTECFQSIESKYRLTYKILKILNNQGIYYSILTRSPLIEEYMDLLKEGYCEGIYFTVNKLSSGLKYLFESRSPSFKMRLETIEKLQDNGLPVTAYFSPVLPLIFDAGETFEALKKIERIEFEGLNFNLGSIEEIIRGLSTLSPEAGDLYRRMKNDVKLYNRVWNELKSEIALQARKHSKKCRVFVHGPAAYFKNVYRNNGRKTE